MRSGTKLGLAVIAVLYVTASIALSCYAVTRAQRDAIETRRNTQQNEQNFIVPQVVRGRVPADV